MVINVNKEHITKDFLIICKKIIDKELNERLNCNVDIDIDKLVITVDTEGEIGVIGEFNGTLFAVDTALAPASIDEYDVAKIKEAGGNIVVSGIGIESVDIEFVIRTGRTVRLPEPKDVIMCMF